jgi:hypothetical protein
VLPPIRTVTVGPGVPPGQPADGIGRVADCHRRFGVSPTPEHALSAPTSVPCPVFRPERRRAPGRARLPRAPGPASASGRHPPGAPWRRIGPVSVRRTTFAGSTARPPDGLPAPPAPVPAPAIPAETRSVSAGPDRAQHVGQAGGLPTMNRRSRRCRYASAVPGQETALHWAASIALARAWSSHNGDDPRRRRGPAALCDYRVLWLPLRSRLARRASAREDIDGRRRD